MNMRAANDENEVHEVRIPAAAVELAGDLVLPEDAFGIVLFAHGSGSGKGSPRNRAVAAFLHEAGLATLLVDLLTEEEAAVDDSTAEHRFDIDLLAERVGKAAEWLAAARETRELAQGYYGASTGAAAALVAAAEHPELARAVVSRGGRPDLADAALPRVQAPTLLIVGGDDTTVLDLNRRALAALRCTKKLEIIPGATHLFPEPGAMAAVSRFARRWFVEHLGVAGASNS